MKSFVDRTPGITDEGKKVLDQLISVYKKNRDDFKKAVDKKAPRKLRFTARKPRNKSAHAKA